jgi:type I restriction enzyme S subunit
MRKEIQFSSLVEVNPQTVLASRVVPFIGMEDVSEDGRLINVGLRPSGEISGGLSVFRNGDVLFAKITPCMENGKGAHVVGLNSDVGLGSTEFHVLRARPGVEARYIFHWTQSKKFRRAAEAMMTGSAGQRRVPAEFFHRYAIPWFALKDQQRIVEILDAVDRHLSDGAGELAKQTLMRSALVEDLIVAATVSSGVSLRLGDFAQISGGVTLGSEPGGESSVELPYLRVANVQDGYFDTDDMKLVRILRSQVDQFSLKAGDLLLTEGGDWDKVGRGAVWDGRLQPCLYQNHLFRVRCDPRRVLSEYLAMYTSSARGKRYFARIAKQTSNLATINSTEIKAMPVPVPPLELQYGFVQSIRDLDDRIEKSNRSLAEMYSIKQGLMDDLLTGRVRV